VIATQNPLEQSGTFALPESQLDRFLMRISLGYPQGEDEKALLRHGHARRESNEAAITKGDLQAHMSNVEGVHISEAIIDYLHIIVQQTRQDNRIVTGLSPRAGIQWLQGAKALAYIEGRDHVIPDDIQELAPYVAAHRIHSHDGTDTSIVIGEIISQTEVI